MHIRRTFILTTLASLAAFSLVAAACSDDDDDDDGGNGGTASTATTASGGDEASVAIADNTFTPDEITISAGDTVTWTWGGSAPHSVIGTSDNATDLINSEQMTGSGTYTVTFDEAGTYEYECGVHGASMAGTIVVE